MFAFGNSRVTIWSPFKTQIRNYKNPEKFGKIAQMNNESLH